MKYMTLQAIKIERFIQTNIETLFFRRNEVIYQEENINSYLYIIYTGQADLIQKFSKGEYSFLLKYQYSSEYIKNMAKRIDYKGVVKSAFQANNNNNIINDIRINKDHSIVDDDNENEYEHDDANENERNYNDKDIIFKTDTNKVKNKKDDSLMLDLLLDRKS